MTREAESSVFSNEIQFQLQHPQLGKEIVVYVFFSVFKNHILGHHQY